MHAHVCKLLDIAYVVGVLCRYLSNPGLMHWKVAKKVLRYIRSIKDFILTYRQTNKLDVVSYIDVDYGGLMDDKKSIIGGVFIMANGAVFWNSAN